MIGSVIRKLFVPTPNIPFEAKERDIEQQQTLASTFPGQIIIDSKQNGSFGVHLLDIASRKLKPLINSDRHEIYPDVSPDGQKIIFCRTESLERTAPGEIWVANADGSNQEKLADNGTFPTFSSNGTHVFFERERTKLISVNLESRDEALLFPTLSSDFGSFAVIKPRISPDGKYCAFTSDKKGRWNTWCADLSSGNFWHVAKACEASWRLDSKRILAIKKQGLLGRTGIYEFSVTPPSGNKKVQDDGLPFGHEYFPSITPDGRFLLFSSCPIGEHDHLSAHYQIFVKDLQSGQVTRVTFDQFTNRWPKFLPDGDLHSN